MIRRLLLGLVGALASAMVTAAPAATTVFTLDPAQSRITLSGDAVGTPFQEQGPGSLTTSFTGTVLADLTPTSIRFVGGSGIDARTNGVWLPGPNGSFDPAPADYAARANAGFTTLLGAFREILLDVTSETIPVAGGSFDSRGLVFFFPTNSNSTLDFDAGFLGSGSAEVAGYATNKASSVASLSNGNQTLTIVIDTQFKFRILADNDSTVRLNGQFVGTVAPAPTGAHIESISVTNQTVRLVVSGATAQSQVESSTDLRTWSPRAASRTTEGNNTVFTTPTQANTEFFRIRN